jgi:sugar/nucleoside kinase (ribokinase family)
LLISKIGGLWEILLKQKPFDLVIVGHISKDIIIIDERKELSAGGSVYYAALAAKPAGCDILAITKLAFADVDLLHGFWRSSVPVLPLFCPQTTAMEDRFSSRDGYVRSSKILSLAEPFKRREFLKLKARVVYIAALMRGEIANDLIESLSHGAKIALDVQGVLRVREQNALIMQDWKEKERLLSCVHFLKADRDEAKLLTGLQDYEEIISCIHGWGVKEILITDDEGVTVSDGKSISNRTFQEYRIEARTGRGDTCFGSFLSWRVSHGVEESIDHCVRITNRKLQNPGPYSA